jgi:hypothetical protein
MMHLRRRDLHNAGLSLLTESGTSGARFESKQA